MGKRSSIVAVPDDMRLSSRRTRPSILGRTMAMLIKKMLDERGCTQREFARRHGLSAGNFSAVVNGNVTSSIRALEAYAALLGYRFVVTFEPLRRDERP